MIHSSTTHALFFSQEGVDFLATEMEQFHFWRWTKLGLIPDAVIYNHDLGKFHNFSKLQRPQKGKQ